MLRLWRHSKPEADLNDLDDVTRFNESIDQSLAKAVSGYHQRVERARNMFLAMLAHDLRNPLEAISLSAQVVSLLHGEDIESAQMLTQIDAHVKTSSQLIRDLTDFAISGLGVSIPVSLAPVNLEQLAADVVGEMRAARPGTQIVYEANGDLMILADAARLRQVLSNVLRNAIQHGSSDTPVRLELVPEGNEVAIKVYNFGPAIAQSAMPLLYKPLTRGPSSSDRARTGSVGLELYIVREIIVAHKGRIDVTSTDSGGALFSVYLPRTAAAATPATTSSGGRRLEISR